MERGAAYRTTRYVLLVLGSVMVLAGTATVAFGTSTIPGTGDFNASVDSEMRFFAVWYVVMGLVLLRSLRELATAGPTVRLVALGFFAAGCARSLSWIVVGRPHTQAVVLMVIELALPLVVVPLHARATITRPAATPIDEPPASREHDAPADR